MIDLDFDPEAIPSQAGKVFVITGGTSGIGKTAIFQLALHNPAHIIFTGRSSTRGDAVKAQTLQIAPSVKVSFVPCDLSDLDSVKQAGKDILDLTDRIDVLIANAAVTSHPPGLTKQGYEIFVGTNLIGHAALFHILLPTLEATTKLTGQSSRIVTVCSEALGLSPPSGVQFSSLKTQMSNSFWYLSTVRTYGHSKLASLLYAFEFAKHHPNILSVSIHPGMVDTEGSAKASWFIRMVFRLTPGVLNSEQGSWNTLWAATNEKDVEAMQGKWFRPVGKEGIAIKPEWLAQAGQVWEWTENELKANGIA